MAVELKVPHVGESIYEVTIAEWFKGEGEYVRQDEPMVSLETDKASLDVPAPASGTISRLLKQPGDSASIGDVLAVIDESTAQTPPPAAVAVASAQGSAGTGTDVPPASSGQVARMMPAARNLIERHSLRPQDITPTGPGGRLLKEDVLRHIDLAEIGAAPSGPMPRPASVTRAMTSGPFTPVSEAPAGVAQAPRVVPPSPNGDRPREVVRMTPLRRRIAERLVQSQQTAALLTTFNEVDMSAVMALRKEHKEAFLQRHGVKLGFMSFFVKAAIEALKEQPALNACVEGENIVYNHFYDIGVAVGGGRGLVVPVLRNAERLSFAEVELSIGDFAVRAKNNKLRPDELQGGTFTISNGGVYGSMLSTPIINPPQSGILGMHNIVERAVVVNGEVVVRPIMFVALTYDHRIVDGRESVTFLKRIKQCIEQPTRILLEV